MQLIRHNNTTKCILTLTTILGKLRQRYNLTILQKSLICAISAKNRIITTTTILYTSICTCSTLLTLATRFYTLLNIIGNLRSLFRNVFTTIHMIMILQLLNFSAFFSTLLLNKLTKTLNIITKIVYIQSTKHIAKR